MNRVRAGFVMVKNPRNPMHVMRVSLQPEDVLAIVFWSRNYGPLLPHLDELDALGYRPCFHLTLTGYGLPLEVHTPDIERALQHFKVLAQRYGRHRVFWRYDPIVLSAQRDVSTHLSHFEALAARIGPLSNRCIISFLDRYPSANRGLEVVTQATHDRFDSPSLTQRVVLAQRMVEIGARHGMGVFACCEPDLISTGLPAASCIDLEVLRGLVGDASMVLKQMPTRKGCGCVVARDIGAYHTCVHGCVYCYANESPERALQNARAVRMDVNHLGDRDIEACAPITKRTRQLRLFDE